jgi:hypothetical protein
MSIEAKQKLSKIRPVTIASRISGVSPSDVSIIDLHGTIIYLNLVQFFEIGISNLISNLK